MKKLLTMIALTSALLGTPVYADEKPSPLNVKQATERLQSGKPVYSCSMKTDWFSEQPGQCPCCEMALEKVKEVKDGKAVFETTEKK
ncbi:MAG: hypothetical protein J0L97_05030 [Alphaproteobacteria bacterium]|nr:hypothetical protein [Alphaproteobacteria bacterium]